MMKIALSYAKLSTSDLVGHASRLGLASTSIISLMERTQVLDLMGTLKLYGMRGAHDEAMATGIERQVSLRRFRRLIHLHLARTHPALLRSLPFLGCAVQDRADLRRDVGLRELLLLSPVVNEGDDIL